MSMQLVLFRHGVAVDRDAADCPPDKDRPLTAKGMAKTAAAARGLLKTLRNPLPNRVLHSPYVRAQQTAHIVAEALKDAGRSPRVESFTVMRPFDDPATLMGHLSLIDVSTIVVGHAPHLDNVLSHLCGADDGTFALKKAGAAIVETDESGRSVITALFPPRVLRALAGRA